MPSLCVTPSVSWPFPGLIWRARDHRDGLPADRGTPAGTPAESGKFPWSGGIGPDHKPFRAGNHSLFAGGRGRSGRAEVLPLMTAASPVARSARSHVRGNVSPGSADADRIGGLA